MRDPGMPLVPLPSEFAGDADMRELVDMFVSDLPERIAAVESAFREAQHAELGRLAHQLKGAAPGYGFSTIGQAADALEQRIKRLDGAPSSVESVRSSVEQLLFLCRRATLR